MPIVLDMVAFITRTVCYDSCPSVTTVLDILCLLTEGYVTIAVHVYRGVCDDSVGYDCVEHDCWRTWLCLLTEASTTTAGHVDRRVCDDSV